MEAAAEVAATEEVRTTAYFFFYFHFTPRPH